MDDENEAPEGAVTVTVETAPSEPAVSADAINAELAEAAAEATLVAAQTAVALAEAQSATVQMEAAQTVAEVTATQRTLEEQVEWLGNQIDSMQATLESLLTPQPSPEPELEVEAETVLVVEPETISLSTPNDTLAPTDETPTEVSGESGSVAENAAPANKPRRRWI